MKLRRSQISMEYIMITGFVMVAVLIPAFLILFSTINNSVYSTVNVQKIDDMGKGLVNDAKQMYYLGLYSHEISTYQVPINTQSIYILNLTKEGNTYYYVGIVVSGKEGQRVFNYQSDVPISSSDTHKYVKKMDSSGIINYVPECGESGITCTAYEFMQGAVQQGKKDFKVETILDESNTALVYVYPVLDSAT